MKQHNIVKIVADSITRYKDRLTSFEIVIPRIILAELNTHRMQSSNTASSRAIPFMKMVESVQTNPFIPFAWQKHHTGMQGYEYLSETEKFNLVEFTESLKVTLESMTSDDYNKSKRRLDEKLEIIDKLLKPFTDLSMTLDEWWLFARDRAIESASLLYVLDVSKQNINRILEPWMWVKVLISGTEWENFFNLRCPRYQTPVSQSVEPQRSWKDLLNIHSNPVNENLIESNKDNILFKLEYNKGDAEIHIMDLAEKMYDALNESTPKLLKPGEWHIPYGDKIDLPEQEDFIDTKIKIAAAMAARVSYTTVGNEREVNYDRMIAIHDDLVSADPIHASPLEHSAIVMDDAEYYSHVKGVVPSSRDDYGYVNYEYYPLVKREIDSDALSVNSNNGNRYGWCRNFKGFKQYRAIIEENERDS